MQLNVKDSARILVVDDDEKILFAFGQVLKGAGFRVFVARDGEEALKALATHEPDIVFMDITMPKLSGLEALKEVRKRAPSVPVILITGYGTMQTAIEAMQLGAFEYLTKPLDVDKIRQETYRALESIKSVEATSQKSPSAKIDFVDRYELVGMSEKMQEVYKLVGSISTTPNQTSVLIVGESGTGKELVAMAIHAHGLNAKEPFIAINCTVVPETLLESELFGHEKGAFTGAAGRKLGKFEIAGNGTIFLDEIGNLSPQLQQKLLRVLQEREFERVGGNDPIDVGARFIAATNRDIGNEVKKGNFREDLFYRLNVVAIQLPPLRERTEDITLLANYFLSKYNERLKKSVKGFSARAMASLQKYSYPGNVRELENLTERALMLTKGNVILPRALSGSLRMNFESAASLPISSPIYSKSRDDVLKMFERQFIVEQLTKHRGNVTAAARASKMTRQNLQRLMKRHKVEAEQFRRRI